MTSTTSVTSTTAPTSATVASARYRRWAARIAGLLGVLALLNAVLPHHRHLLSAASVPLPHQAGEMVGAAVTVSGLLLFRLATGLRRGKRTAWRLAVAACAVAVVGDLLRGERRPVAAAVTIGLLLALVVGRRHFTTRSDPHGRTFALLVLLQGAVGGLLLGLVLMATRLHVAPRTGFGDRVLEVLGSLLGMSGWVRYTSQSGVDLFQWTLLIWGAVTAILALIAVMRSTEPRPGLVEQDEQRLRATLAKHGERDSLGYFALRSDKMLVWSASGKAAVSFRVVAGVALISGDPLGDPEAWPHALAEYRRLTDEYGWAQAVMGCSAQGAAVIVRELGLACLALGDEAIVDVADFSLDGRAMRGVRQACARVERAGYEVTVRRIGDLTPDELAELRTAADSWRVDPVERGFSMALSRIGSPGDEGCVVVTAHRDGVLAGLLQFVPWGRNGLSLDLMRRDRNADNGLNEYLIAQLVERCPELGVSRVSLNFAVFREALDRGAQLGAGPVLRLWRNVLVFASRWWQIDSLYRFNEKFRPRWEPRYICYGGVRDIPRVALAALEAEAFFVRPRLLKRVLGRA